jgi:para-nitrobenzyl esterase
MSSGGGVSKLMDSKATAEDRYEFWQRVMKESGCNTIQEFLALEPEKLFATWQTLKKSSPKYGMVAAPCLDGHLLVKSALDATAAGEQKQIPYMAGSTSHDIVPLFIQQMAKDWCERQKTPSYAWFFDRKLPGDDNGAWHSSDLWYWFGTLKNCWRPMEDRDYMLSDLCTTYLCNFVKTGNPNGENVPEWKAAKKGQKEVLRWGEGSIRMDKVSQLKLAHTMLTNKAVGE